MTTDDMEIVAALRSLLAGTVGPERYELWFGADTRLAMVGGALRIEVPSKFYLDWIRTNFRGALESACQTVLGRTIALEFHVVAAADKAPAKTAANGTVAARAATLADQRAPAATAATAMAPAAAPGEVSNNAQRGFHALDSFVVGNSNRLAAASAELAAMQPGHISPLMICGPTSVGKTHLLQGILTAARRKHPNLRALYLAAEQFLTGFVDALRGSGLPSFRRKYRGVELLIIDDLQFFSSKRHTQIELLHTIDELSRHGRQLVFAADRSPNEFTDWAPELVTRLGAGMVCRLDPPDYATRLGIVERWAQHYDVTLPREVREFVAARLTGHARELSGAVCRLKATSQALGHTITLAMAQETLADMIRTSSKVVKLHDIEKAVCDVLGVDAQELQSHCKAKDVSYPRMLAMWLARKHTRAALSEIGEYFGRRSHSTVISAQRRVDDWMAAGIPLRLSHNIWHVDEAIRLVEKRLIAS